MSAPPLGSPISGEGAPRWRLPLFLRTWPASLVMAMYRTRIRGLENLPPEGGYIIAGNHVSYLDPVLLWCAAPRPVHFIARDNLFGLPIARWWLPRLWAFPITRASADREAIQRATKLLQVGDVVGIFPEGTRQATSETADQDLGAAHSGVSFIAQRANAPIVPVGISGTQKALPRGAILPRFPRVTFCFGEPVYPAQFEALDRKERLSAITAEVMRRVTEQRNLAAKE
jgi:1-acyl-sn-glycerol-3-phosphate acyltransferase